MDKLAWQLFHRVADEYDEVLPFFASYGEAIVAALAPPAGCRFLDLGAGRGALTAAALRRGCVVTAVDAAPGMVSRLAAAFTDASVQAMDATALTFPDDSFDLVAAAFVIHLLADPTRAVAQAHRVVAPGGRFALTAGGAEAPDSQLARGFDALFGEFSAYLPAGGGMGGPIDAERLLAEAGFVDIRMERAEVAMAVPDNDTLWRWAMSHGYRAFVEDLPEARQAEFHDRVLALPVRDRVLRRATAVWSGRKIPESAPPA